MITRSSYFITVFFSLCGCVTNNGGDGTPMNQATDSSYSVVTTLGQVELGHWTFTSANDDQKKDSTSTALQKLFGRDSAGK